MATKRSKTNGSKQAGSFGVDFLNVRLTSEDKQELQKWEPTTDDLMAALVRIVEAGHKLSFSWAESNDSAIVTITSPGPTKTANKIAVSSFGSMVENALMSAIYKFEVLAQSGDWALVEGRQDYGDFG